MESNQTDIFLNEKESQIIIPLFTGNTKFGNMTAFYFQNGEHIIQFELFELREGKVFGHGNDEVGTFTVEGNYSMEDCKGVINMEKKYIGQHTVHYEGTIQLTTNSYEIEGMWNINEEISGKFSIVLYHNITVFNETPEYYSNPIDITGLTTGFYIQNGTRFDMSFDNLAFFNGCITGRGSDNNGRFFIYGNYTEPFLNTDVQFTFKKEYEQTHDVSYSGILKQAKNPLQLVGRWMIGQLSGYFCINIPRIRKLSIYLYSFVTGEECKKNLFENECVDGNFYLHETTFKMSFKFFRLNKGNVSGQGSDDLGSFTIEGEYSSEGKINFKKHYIGQRRSVEFSGTIVGDGKVFEINGTWVLDDNIEGKFLIKLFV
ncbi:uncharacterized protein LOC124818523 [Hydra vulgaris]|uniref:uncharacterized protein LOC124818523 n=1 Tax=Hydra vulgaris TaxID=6087 RepID=UPI001F5F9DB3|nr:uncharacterized protein LOC124818523 [Hydra vulgaris]